MLLRSSRRISSILSQFQPSRVRKGIHFQCVLPCFTMFYYFFSQPLWCQGNTPHPDCLPMPPRMRSTNQFTPTITSTSDTILSRRPTSSRPRSRSSCWGHQKVRFCLLVKLGRTPAIHIALWTHLPEVKKHGGFLEVFWSITFLVIGNPSKS